MITFSYGGIQSDIRQVGLRGHYCQLTKVWCNLSLFYLLYAAYKHFISFHPVALSMQVPEDPRQENQISTVKDLSTDLLLTITRSM